MFSKSTTSVAGECTCTCEMQGRATSSNALTATRDSLIATNIFGCPSQRPFPQLLIYTCLSLVLHCQETGAFLLIDMMQQGKKKVQ